ncbi:MULTISPECIES: dipeptide ABC transporter ATP-binding protein [Bradyrhizobium]|uniref:ABC transporter ATP-binding protein n=1 Tax=Bradyrhizobium diazoefficiens (strain JCM 10833 / BCRC 13528 / IAM 13628 / NBRC 14792 / USDA 110) TaxID=224911 RepID=Q89VK6_BRADU|nr:ABC transporter ATP-binding protein [Bradyrhizobium diazoefficiens]MBP1060270.1 peptide/nickel transport system ATP-binding protein [Bradyrhizobium japonicum]AND86745.1 ABC transporter ATP-binding protein [Bradyrhizobium diazoefficiens USDA 110]AWO88155.1 ABC transporter ATP-binding protein [Bradyrhizobium diazoefficiens]PDT62130.1 ABC transporter ATP-binding protein [Bradyrhizobium diazoefficiens]QBP19977.1 ABC transporter ATP-binding protein [Bradyrhizobium diazoefficiens]
MTAQPLLDVQDLTVEFTTRRGIVKAVQHVNISVAKGETLAIVGESGSGKSVTSYAVMRILDRAGRIAEGSVMFSGIDVKAATEDQMRDLRGREVSMIFQNPRAALNPIRKVGDQIEDVLRTHVQQAQVADHGEKAIEALEQVKIARPRERYHAYPFELSGGMCQRVVIALALACNPQLLIADEPTTGLDVTTQKAVMDLIVELTRRRAMSTILITHDLGLAAAYCDRVVVMEKGRVVETATAADIFANPQHPYTKKLMRATPRLGVSLRDLLPEEEGASFASPRVRGEADARSAGGEGDSPSTVLAETPPHPNPLSASEARRDPASGERGKSEQPLLLIEKLVKEYPRQGATATLGKLFGRKPPVEPDVFRAVDGISFSIGHGESVGLVGESGCGKSTTSMMVMRLLDQTSGLIQFDGEDIGGIAPASFARLPQRSRIQMVFQDPTDSLNPRFTAARAIADPIMQLGDVRGRDALRARCEELATMVGLPHNLLDRFPHQLSGGQKARVGIARAIALHPKLVILDEPTAALDVSVQALVLNLLQDLKARLGMSYLFVSHDLNVVRLLCDRVIVMRTGRIVEEGSSERVLSDPQDDYTKELLTAIPHPPLPVH